MHITFPHYQRSLKDLHTGITHIGVGGFHRSHLAMYIDELLNASQSGRLTPNANGKSGGVVKASDWGICGIGLMPGDKFIKDAFERQDNLYTLVEKDHDEAAPRVIGSIVDYLYALDDSQKVINRMANRNNRIVSMTLTESGYYYDADIDGLQLDHPNIVHDLENPGDPKTVYGLIVAALAKRYEYGAMPFTLMSTDNLPGNGHLLKRMLLTFINAQDATLAEWLEETGAFPNSMVDRITPRTPPSLSTSLERDYGLIDEVPVMAEQFAQFIIEDKFSQGRPAFEEVGAQIVESVEPYELMKLRLLNASHSMIGYTGYLCGYDYIHEAVQDPLVARLVDQFANKEVLPLLPEVEGINLHEYIQTLIRRFSNPALGDTTTRICGDGSGKVPKFILPSIHEQIKFERHYQASIFGVASWFRYCLGEDERGKRYDIQDSIIGDAELRRRAKEGGKDPHPLLESGIIMPQLRNDEQFVKALGGYLADIYDLGMKAALEKFHANQE